MKTARRLFSLALVLVMVLSLSVTAFATSDAPTVTVYVTRGMYTAGGFDPDHGFIDQSLLPADPASKLITTDFFTGYDGENYWYDESSLAAELGTTQAVYAPEGYTSSTVTVLDAIIYALQFNGYTCSGGWDSVSQPNGGYVHSVFPEMEGTSHVGKETINGVEYNKYTGMGWRIAIKNAGETEFRSLTAYGTSVPIQDGMEIIFDYSYYCIYSLE